MEENKRRANLLREGSNGKYHFADNNLNRLLALLITGTGILVADCFNVPNPAIVCLIGVVFSTFVGGFLYGAISSLISLFYCCYYFSLNHSFFSYSKENLYKIIVIIAALVTIVTMVGILKKRVERRTKELEIANKNLLKMSISDELTGLYNYRHFINSIDIEWRRSTRNAESISIAMIDIDYFKKYNDNYGHHAGNECIQEVARIIKGQLHRPGDFVARYGGEEFVVLMPNTDGAGAKKTMEDVKSELDHAQIEHKFSGIKPYITISIGISTEIPERNSSFETIIKEADYALYDAKRSGRDRIVSYL